jgi:ferredoxin
MKVCTIYYFSGTGNAQHAALWFSKAAEEKGMKIETHNLASLKNRRVIEKPAPGLVLFSGPTHGFNYSPLLFFYILRFPRGKNRVVLMNTRAGIKAGPFFLPGLSGMALMLPALILLFKGYSIAGLKPVDLPSNWISIHPGQRKETIEKIYAWRKPQVEAFAEKILQGRRVLTGLRTLPIDLAITPIGILYHVIGRFFLGKTFIASRDCTMCGRCLRECPVQAIEEVDGRPFWTWRCESCMKCMNSCPERAIETAHGFIFLVVYLTYALFIHRLYGWMDIPLMVETHSNSFIALLVQMSLETIIMFPLLYGGYRLLHLLLKVRFIERIVVWTSLTKLPFWNRIRPPGK